MRYSKRETKFIGYELKKAMDQADQSDGTDKVVVNLLGTETATAIHVLHLRTSRYILRLCNRTVNN